MPSVRARSRAYRRLASEVYRDGIMTPLTDSRPRASTAMHATREESTPPLSPSTTVRIPFFRT